MESSIHLGSLKGIAIGVHYTWLIVFGLVTMSLAGSYFPQEYPNWSIPMYWMIGSLSSLLLFASVLVHELAHSLVAISKGLPVRSITLFIFGGVASITKEAEKPADELLVAIVGPASSTALAALFWMTWVLTKSLSEEAAAISLYLCTINLMLAVFNLIPGFPLDGGRVLRALIWAITKNLIRATRIATAVGQTIGYAFVFSGLMMAFGMSLSFSLGSLAINLAGGWLNGLWLMFIGWFLNNAAEMSYRQTMIQETLKGITVRDMMIRDFTTVEPDITLDELVNHYILQRGLRALPVVERTHLIGMITLSDVKHVPQEQWLTRTVREAMTKAEDLRTVSPLDDVGRVLATLDGHDLNQAPVVYQGQLVGMITRSNLIRFLRVRQELGLHR
ncbi:MAG: site-2 protease family protein [Chloroflexi bacterium]|nr:site-2 protease family protein [Chloroflexota bacterium]MCL5074437.1 site-2 protease family protein [Chloroflexota bacterium]